MLSPFRGTLKSSACLSLVNASYFSTQKSRGQDLAKRVEELTRENALLREQLEPKTESERWGDLGRRIVGGVAGIGIFALWIGVMTTDWKSWSASKCD